MKTIFITGFPGFLGSQLMERWLQKSANIQIIALVQPKFIPLAKRKMAEWQKVFESTGHIKLVKGDITQKNLGTAIQNLPVDTIDEIFHFAAVYDLGIDRPTAYAINVQGTKHMLHFSQRFPHLKRFHYVSTCYVSGRYEGWFNENDLDKKQEFNNYYEETKFLAEVNVQDAMKKGLPGTIYRPAIVVGDSRTGATQKFDGPYYVFQWLLRQHSRPILPITGDPTQYHVNLVPSDFVVDTIAFLSELPDSINKIYHISDPNPLTVHKLLVHYEKVTEQRILKIPFPKSIIKGAIKYIPGVKDLIRIEPEAIDYFEHPTRYSCTNTLQDLQASDITCPALPSYLPSLIHYMKRNPAIRNRAMI